MDEKLLEATATITAALLQETCLEKPLHKRAQLVYPLFQLVYGELHSAQTGLKNHIGKESYIEHMTSLWHTLEEREKS